MIVADKKYLNWEEFVMYDWQRRKLKRELGDLYDIFSGYECYLSGGAITSIFTNTDSPIMSLIRVKSI